MAQEGTLNLEPSGIWNVIRSTPVSTPIRASAGAAQESHPANSGSLLERDDRAGLLRFQELGQRPCPRVKGGALLRIVGVVVVVDVRGLRRGSARSQVRTSAAQQIRPELLDGR